MREFSYVADQAMCVLKISQLHQNQKVHFEHSLPICHYQIVYEKAEAVHAIKAAQTSDTKVQESRLFHASDTV